MDTTQQLIITLLKSAVTEEVLPLPEGFSLEEACEMIQKQELATLAYDGAIRCGISPASVGDETTVPELLQSVASQ